jgi:hypothetical protein
MAEIRHIDAAELEAAKAWLTPSRGAWEGLA